MMLSQRVLVVWEGDYLSMWVGAGVHVRPYAHVNDQISSCNSSEINLTPLI